MAHPEYLFYATVLLLVVPSAPFSRVAAVVLATWVLGFVAPDLRLASLLVAFPVTLMFARSATQLAVAVLYLPICVCALASHYGVMDPYFCYWLDFWLAMMRNLLVPFTVDGARALATARQGMRGYLTVRTPPEWRVSALAFLTSSLRRRPGFTPEVVAGIAGA